MRFGENLEFPSADCPFVPGPEGLCPFVYTAKQVFPRSGFVLRISRNESAHSDR